MKPFDVTSRPKSCHQIITFSRCFAATHHGTRLSCLLPPLRNWDDSCAFRAEPATGPSVASKVIGLNITMASQLTFPNCGLQSWPNGELPTLKDYYLSLFVESRQIEFQAASSRPKSYPNTGKVMMPRYASI
ncbi:zinc finger C2H2 type [Echinococcus multilocularis]|uniref:Zinc finger C2H2 type n=1 Tax=Echinococcus multilocularis TaxID=6211 RepID=A0A0S4MLY8_ECHMU|nr:zinc finger C2H2 type [Echinococcus multilocularis]